MNSHYCSDKEIKKITKNIVEFLPTIDAISDFGNDRNKI